MMLFCRCSQLKCRKTRAWAAGASVRNTLDPRPQRPPTTTTDDRKTPPTIADGTRKGAAKGPAHDEPPLRGLQLPVEKPLMTRAWRLDEKPWPLGQTGALDFSQRPLKAKLAYCPRPRPLTQTTRASAPQILTTPARRKTAAIFARAAAHTAKRQLLAEGVAAAMRRRRARAAHITRDHRASETTHKPRPPTRVTQTSPRALQPTHTPKRAGPLPHEAGRPRPS